MTAFKLENEPKIRSGFKTPEGYFELLPHQVAQRLDEKPVIPLHRKRRFLYAAAAIILLALMIPFYDSMSSSDGLDEPTLENYLAYHSGLSQYDLMTLLEEEDINNMEIELQIDNTYLEEVLSSNSNIEQLLIE